MKHINKLGLLFLSMSVLVPTVNAQSYIGIKAIAATNELKSMDFENGNILPGTKQKLDGPTDDTVSGLSIFYGKKFRGWRGELELASLESSSHDSHWMPFPAWKQRVDTKSLRVMANAYKDFKLTPAFSANVNFGLGWAQVKMGGVQSLDPVSASFVSDTANNLAYSVGAGLEYAVNKRNSIDLGLRYNDLGKAKTQVSYLYPPNPERYSGKVRNTELTVGWKYSF